MRKLFLCTIFGLAAVTASFAQKVVSEAKISYDVKIDLPANTPPQMADMLDGATMTLYIKGPLSRLDMNMTLFNNTTFYNAQDKSATVLMEAGGNKYMIRAKREELEKQRPENEKYLGVIFEDQAETRKIAGYNCKKAIAKLKDGSNFTVFYTPDVVPENREYSIQFENLKGLPLVYEMVQNNLKMKFTATNVDLNPVPASIFDIPKTGYKELTLADLRRMQGR